MTGMLEINLLTSFLAVVDAQSFTAGAQAVGLSQPTVSQHIRRLEALTGRQLLARDTHAVALTPDGAMLARFAREIVSVHAQAAAYYAGSAPRGRVRFGVAEDLALTRLPAILRQFRRQSASMDVELTVGLTSMLYQRLDAGRLDLVFAKRQPGDDRGVVIRREPLVWIAHRDLRLEPDERVPLVMYPSASITSSLAMQALETAGRPWFMACSSETLSGIWSGVQAGLGVAAQSQLLLSLPRGDVSPVGPDAALPPLGEVEFVVLGRSARLHGPAAALAALIEEEGPQLFWPALAGRTA
jgi:DNA-binding transcriptional LysR family regulator